MNPLGIPFHTCNKFNAKKVKVKKLANLASILLTCQALKQLKRRFNLSQ